MVDDKFKIQVFFDTNDRKSFIISQTQFIWLVFFMRFAVTHTPINLQHYSYKMQW